MGSKQKKQRAFRKIEKDFRLQLLIFVVLSFIVIIAYIVVGNIIDERLHRRYTIVDSATLVKGVENITIDSDRIMIEGYAFMSVRDTSDDLISVFLRNIVTEEEVWLDMEQIDRPEVNAYFAGEYDYKNTGFIASTASKKLDDNEVYEIVLNIDYVQTDEDISKDIRRTVSTNSYVLDGEWYAYNPIEFDKSDMNVESELLAEVFANGHLCLYQKEEGMYVYQYNDRMYWVANDKFAFKDDGLSYIQYQLHTSQKEKLPEHRIQHGFDNIGFNFEEYEYTDENTAPYRVAIRDIPAEYPILHIITGVYDSVNSEWTWRRHFHINHKFN